MSRRLLEAAGFDPDEEITLTPDLVCGHAALDFFERCDGLPTDDESKQKIIDIANEDLAAAGLQPGVGNATLQRVLRVIRAAGIAQ